jgi:hypothetical protein
MRFFIPVIVVCTAGFLQACPAKVDQMTIGRVLPAALEQGNIPQACAMGSAFTPALAALGTKRKAPEVALAVTGVASAICAELETQEADLRAESVRKHSMGQPYAIQAYTDARIARARAHTRAAKEFHTVWNSFQTLYPGAEELCPKLSTKEEPVYLIGLLSGLLSVLHDGNGGRQAAIPQDVVLQAARAARCLPSERWFEVPAAIEAAAWGCIPGSGPKDVDPFQRLNELSVAGSQQGVRLTRALQVLVSANAGRDQEVAAGIESAALSFESTPGANEWMLLDELSFSLIQHESDLIWIRASGHRTEKLGVLPNAEPADSEINNTPDESDPFGEPPSPEADPFQ